MLLFYMSLLYIFIVAELVSELLKYLRICYSDFLVLAGDPPVPDMIYLPKYFHDFTNFIYQDRKIPAQSFNNTTPAQHWDQHKWQQGV